MRNTPACVLRSMRCSASLARLLQTLVSCRPRFDFTASSGEDDDDDDESEEEAIKPVRKKGKS